MKVFITSTPEISKKEVDEVFKLLAEVNGPIKFKQLPSMSYDSIDSMVDRGDSFENVRTLSFDGLFEVCKIYRNYYTYSEGITKEDFCVVLTSIKNEHNWFSAFRGKNIFVDINDWEDYTNKNQKFGIAYQVVENLFQSFLNMKIEIGDVESEPNVHWQSEGCINDMCQNKRDIILKLRTAEICESCQDRMESENANVEACIQIQEIIERIREELISKIVNRLKPKARPLEVKKVGRKFEIFIDGINDAVDFEAIQRTLYIFYLKNSEGVHHYDLIRKKEELKNIYFKVRHGGTDSTIDLLTNPRENSFIKVKGALNKKLIQLLGDALSEYYLIKKDSEIYKIKLDDSLKTIDKEL